jgi:phosphopantetheine--protein transferase-like protein
MEMVDALPVESDYWKGEFYATHFTPAEIAYCLTKPEPRQHFAARWCAKEALKKCDARFASSDFIAIEVVIGPAGKPALRAKAGPNWIDLPHAASLTHTPLVAAAVVVSANAMAVPVPSQPAPAPANGENAPRAGLLGRLLGK